MRKWVSLKRGGRKEKQRKLRTTAPSGESTEFDDELRARFKRSNGKASSTSSSTAHRSAKQGAQTSAKSKPSNASAATAPSTPSPPPPNYFARNKSVPLNEMAREALNDAAQKRHGNGAAGGPTSVHSATTDATPPLLPRFAASVGDPPNLGDTWPSGLSSNNNAHRISLDKLVVEALGEAEASRIACSAAQPTRKEEEGGRRRTRSSVGENLGSSGSPASDRSDRGGSGAKRGGKSARSSDPRHGKHKSRERGGDGAMYGDDDDDDNASLTSQGSSVLSGAYNRIRGIMRSKSRSSKRDRKASGSSSNNRQDHASGKKTSKHRSNRPGTAARGGAQPGGPPPETSQDGEEEKVPPSLQFREMEILQEESSGGGTPSRGVVEGSAPNNVARPPSDSRAREMSGDSPAADPRSGMSGGVAGPPDGRVPSAARANGCGTVVTSDSSEFEPPTSVYSSVGHSVGVATKGPAGNLLSISPDGGTAIVIDLPWMDDASEGKLRGLYSGPVSIRPHGSGTLVLDGNSSLKFNGRWTDGRLVTPLVNDDDGSPVKFGGDAKSAYDERKKNSYGRRKTTAEYGTNSCPEYKRRSSTNSSAVSTSYGDEWRRRASLPSSAASDHVDPAHGNLVVGDFSNLVPPNLFPDRVEARETVSSSKPSSGDGSRGDGAACPPGPKYALGEIAHTPRDMIIHRSNEKAIESASLLEKHERAFLKRSNGVWTCAVLADRTSQPTNAPSTRAHWHTEDEIDEGSMRLEECMLFVINEDGATKIVKRRHWGKFVRRMQTDGGDEGGGVPASRSTSRGGSSDGLLTL